jgi:hypothetical protein
MKLSTFTGHVDPTSTAVYLTIAAELPDSAARRLNDFGAIERVQIMMTIGRLTTCPSKPHQSK